jgi:nucleotide-binding universal stress UspA family protein
MVRVLVPIRVLEGQSVGDGVLELLSAAEVVLLGYHVIPDQTAPSQARLSFEERARAGLVNVAEAFENRGIGVETVLVFTQEGQKTVDRVAAEHRCDAVLYLNPAMKMDHVLVALYGDVNAERIGLFVASLLDGGQFDVTFLELTEPGQTGELLERVHAALREADVTTDRMDERRVTADRPVADLAAAAVDFDALVVGEKSPSLSSFLLGNFEQRVADESVGPVLVVRSRSA